MNERIERLVKVAKERLVENHATDISNLHEMRDRLEDLLSDKEQEELTRAWENMLVEVKLGEWDEDFLKIIDGTYESPYMYGYTTKKQEALNHKRRMEEMERQERMQQQAYTRVASNTKGTY